MLNSATGQPPISLGRANEAAVSDVDSNWLADSARTESDA